MTKLIYGKFLTTILQNISVEEFMERKKTKEKEKQKNR